MKIRKLAASLTLALAGAGVLATTLPMGAVAAPTQIAAADAAAPQSPEARPEQGARGEGPGREGGRHGAHGHDGRGHGPEGRDHDGRGPHGEHGPRGPMGHPGGPGMMGPMGGAMALFGFSPFGMQPFFGAPPAKPADLAAQGKMSPEKAAKVQKEMQARAEKREKWMAHRLEKRIDDVIESLDGTPDQAKQINAIARTAMQDMKPLGERLRALDARGAELVRADTLDRGAFEALRVERMKLMDEMSQRSNAAWLDMAAVLRTEQRQKLMDEGARPRGFGFFGRGPWGHGPDHDMKRPPRPLPGEATEETPPPPLGE